MNNFNRAVVAAMMTAVAVPVAAAPEYSTARVTVDYKGIDLASASGRQELDQRVDGAIRAMCGSPVFGTREEAAELGACRAEARAAVDPQLQAVLAKANLTVASNN
jgi:UrcA family protein